MNRALLLDRDGTLIVEKHYLRDPDLVELIPGVIETIARFRDAGFKIIVVTNQSGVARGLMTDDDVRAVHAKILNLGAAVDAFYFCPHGPVDGCPCRKPLPGMAIQAASEFDLDLSNSIVVGDKSADLQLGANIGSRTVLVRTGYGRETELTYPGEVIDSIADLTFG